MSSRKLLLENFIETEADADESEEEPSTITISTPRVQEAARSFATLPIDEVSVCQSGAIIFWADVRPCIATEQR